MAQGVGIEPTLTVLEAVVLPLDDLYIFKDQFHNSIFRPSFCEAFFGLMYLTQTILPTAALNSFANPLGILVRIWVL